MVNYDDPIIRLRGIFLGLVIGAVMWVVIIWLATLI